MSNRAGSEAGEGGGAFRSDRVAGVGEPVERASEEVYVGTREDELTKGFVAIPRWGGEDDDAVGEERHGGVGIPRGLGDEGVPCSMERMMDVYDAMVVEFGCCPAIRWYRCNEDMVDESRKGDCLKRQGVYMDASLGDTKLGFECCFRFDRSSSLCAVPIRSLIPTQSSERPVGADLGALCARPWSKKAPRASTMYTLKLAPPMRLEKAPSVSLAGTRLSVDRG